MRVHDAAVHLALDEHRVDRPAAVVHRHVADDRDLAGVGVHLDDRRVGPERPDEVVRVVERVLLESRLHALRDALGHVGRTGDVGERQALVRRAADLVLAVHDLDVLGRRLEHVGGELLGLVGHLVGGARHRLAADGQRARAVGAHAERALGGVAVDDLDLGRVDAEPVGHDLREAGLVALAVRRAAGVGGDRARRVHAHDRRLPEAALQAHAARADHARRRDAADLHVGGEADAAVDALVAQLGLLAAERVHVDVLEQLVERALIVARVVDHADRPPRRGTPPWG